MVTAYPARRPDVFVGDRVLDAAARLYPKGKWRVRPPSKKYSHRGKRVAMDPKQYETFSILAGKTASLAVEDELWNLYKPSRKDAEKIKGIISKSRTKALNALKGHWHNQEPLPTAKELAKTLVKDQRDRAENMVRGRFSRRTEERGKPQGGPNWNRKKLSEEDYCAEYLEFIETQDYANEYLKKKVGRKYRARRYFGPIYQKRAQRRCLPPTK